MTNVAHSTLTGTNLHEPKGADTATSGQVYIANGAGSGAWTALGAATNPLANAMFYVQDNVGLPTQTLTADTWNTRRLNSLLINQISGASLSTNAIVLPLGTYWLQGSVRWSTPDNGSFNSYLRLYNVTDSAIINYGQGASVTLNPSFIYSTTIPIFSRFALGGTKTISLQHYSTTHDTYGGIDFSTPYLDLMIWKIA